MRVPVVVDLTPIFSLPSGKISQTLSQDVANVLNELRSSLSFGVPMTISKKKGVGHHTNPTPEALQQPRKRTLGNDSTG
jgi:hypothetical protein